MGGGALAVRGAMGAWALAVRGGGEMAHGAGTGGARQSTRYDDGACGESGWEARAHAGVLEERGGAGSGGAARIGRRGGYHSTCRCGGRTGGEARESRAARRGERSTRVRAVKRTARPAVAAAASGGGGG